MLRRSWSRLVMSWVGGLRHQKGSRQSRERRHPSSIRVESLESRVLLSAPIAFDDAYRLPHDRSFAPQAGVLDNDADLDFDPLVAELVAGTAHGTVTLLPSGQFTYIPQLHFTGADSFSYRVFDGTEYSDVATVRLTIANSAPIAIADSYTVTTDTFDSAFESAASLVANDVDVDGDSLSPVLVSAPSHGSVTLRADGSFRYVPTFNWFGVDTFTYKANDGVSDSSSVPVTLSVVSPFGAQANLSDVPVAGVQSFGTYATSILTGEAQVAVEAGRRTLVYNSVTTDLKPVIAVETQFTGFAIPTGIEAQLTFNGVVGSTVYFRTEDLFSGDSLRFALQADASSLVTGHYNWTMRLIARFDGKSAIRDFSGTYDVVNRNRSEFGSGWNLADLDRLYSSAGGQLFVSGTGASLFFASTGGSTFASPAGPLAFSSLLKNSNGTFTLKAKTGEVENFNSAGLLTSQVDLNGNTTTYSYVDTNADGLATELSTITDPFGRLTKFNYTSGKVSSVTDYSGRITTLTRDTGTRITSVTSPDPDATGPLVSPVTTYTYDAANHITSIALPEGRITQLQYSFAGRLVSVVNADSSRRQFMPLQTVGLVDPASGGGSQSLPAPKRELVRRACRSPTN